MGAVIVLLPADPDSVAASDGDTATDLHVTMLYLSDNAFAAEQIDEILAAITACATCPPIEADVSGAGVLGKDAAVVLILESQELCDLHAHLTDSCQSFVVADKFPSFIPHLTIGFPEDIDHGESLLHHVLPMIGNTVTLDRLALFNGDDHHEIPLGAAAAETVEPSVEPDTVAYTFGRFAAPAPVPAPAPGAAPPGSSAVPAAGKPPVILVGMPVVDPSKVPYAPTGLPYQSPAPYVALLEVKIRKNEVPEQLAQVLATIHLEPATSTATKSLTASDTSPPRRAVLMDPAPLAAASDAIKAALEPYGTNVDDYPFVIQLGNERLTKGDVIALKGQAIDFAGMIAVLEDGTVIHEDTTSAKAPPTGSPPETTTPVTVAPT